MLEWACENTDIIISIMALLFSIGIYIHGINRERKNDTLKCFSEIRRKYYNTKNFDDKEKLKYLNELEFFATGINTGIYSIKIVKKLSGSRLIKQYNYTMADFIHSRREKYGDEKTYCEYEKMIKKLRSMK